MYFSIMQTSWFVHSTITHNTHYKTKKCVTIIDKKKYTDHKSRLKNKFMDLNAIYYCIMIFMNPSTILKNILLCIAYEM